MAQLTYYDDSDKIGSYTLQWDHRVESDVNTGLTSDIWARLLKGKLVLLKALQKYRKSETSNAHPNGCLAECELFQGKTRNKGRSEGPKSIRSGTKIRGQG